MDRGRDGGSLGLDLWVGLPSSEEHRVGRAGKVEAPEPSGALRARPKRSVTAAYADPDSLTRRAFAAIGPTPDHNDPAFHAAALPAANGIATADGLARFYASLVGPVDGVRLLAPDTVERARAEESAGPDRVLIVGTRFGLGYMLHGSASPPGPGLLRPPRPRRLPRLRRPGVGRRLRLRHQRLPQDGHGGSQGAGTDTGGTGVRHRVLDVDRAQTWIGWETRPDASSISRCALSSICMASSFRARAPAISSPTRG